ncbi:hypothetical protein BX666DRAFT_1320849 [Dichotomocladium elegans]|nr:hypothetical protein BX666DRAFT_1320849 [Dichotomocladium elegans]
MQAFRAARKFIQSSAVLLLFVSLSLLRSPRMAITELFQLIKSVQEPVQLACYAGKTLAIDGSHWLSVDAATARDEQRHSTRKKCHAGKTDGSDEYLDPFLERISALCSHGVTPIIVFESQPAQADNSDIPPKHHTGKKDENDGKSQDYTKNYERNMNHLQKANSIAVLQQRLDERKLQHITVRGDMNAQLAHLVQTKKSHGVLLMEDQNRACLDLIFRHSCRSVLLLKRGDDEKTSMSVSRFGDLAETADLDLKNWSTMDLYRFYVLATTTDGLELKDLHARLIRHEHNMDALFKDLNHPDAEKAFREEYDKAPLLHCKVRDSDSGLDNKKKTAISEIPEGEVINAPHGSSQSKIAINVSGPSKAGSITGIFSSDDKENLPPWLTRRHVPVHRETYHRPRRPQSSAVAAVAATAGTTAVADESRRSRVRQSKLSCGVENKKHIGVNENSDDQASKNKPTNKKSISNENNPAAQHPKRKIIDENNQDHIPDSKRRDLVSLKAPPSSLPSRRSFGLADQSNRIL